MVQNVRFRRNKSTLDFKQEITVMHQAESWPSSINYCRENTVDRSYFCSLVTRYSLEESNILWIAPRATTQSGFNLLAILSLFFNLFPD